MGELFKPDFNFGDKVIIDGDASLVATVTAFTYRSNASQVEVSYFHLGEAKTAWVEEYRIKLA